MGFVHFSEFSLLTTAREEACVFNNNVADVADVNLDL
jgi:hypothetical protein